MSYHVSIKAGDRMALSQFVGKVVSFEIGDHIVFGIFSPHVGKRLGFVSPRKLMSFSGRVF